MESGNRTGALLRESAFPQGIGLGSLAVVVDVGRRRAAIDPEPQPSGCAVLRGHIFAAARFKQPRRDGQGMTYAVGFRVRRAISLA